MLKKLLIITIIATQIPVSSFSQDRDIHGKIQITQNNRIIQPLENKFAIEDSKFEMVIEDIREDENIAIFAYHTNEMFSRYKLPMKTSETVMFAPGTGLAMTVDESTSLYLRINSEYTQNYISKDRRIISNNDTIIRIKGFEDTFNRFQNSRIAYLSVFVDYNKNKIIEENELYNCSIILKNINYFSEKPKVYISTMGSRISLINSNNNLHTSFLLVKITDTKEAERFSKYIENNTTYYSGFRRGGIMNINYDIENKYFLLSPNGSFLNLNQPFHYSGENALIFEVNTDREKLKSNEMTLREYTVLKKDDIFEIAIYLDKKLIFPMIFTEY